MCYAQITDKGNIYQDWFCSCSRFEGKEDKTKYPLLVSFQDQHRYQQMKELEKALKTNQSTSTQHVTPYAEGMFSL